MVCWKELIKKKLNGNNLDFFIHDKPVYFYLLFNNFHMRIHAVNTLQYFSGAITIFPYYFLLFFSKSEMFNRYIWPCGTGLVKKVIFLIYFSQSCFKLWSLFQKMEGPWRIHYLLGCAGWQFFPLGNHSSVSEFIYWNA